MNLPLLDDLAVQIPFSKSWVEGFHKELDDFCPFSRKGVFNVLNHYMSVNTGAKTITFVNGQPKIDDLYHPWESIPSHYSGLALKVYSEGNRFCNWPYIELKCSPAKLLQGHNVYGSCDVRQAFHNQLWLLNQTYPEFAAGHEVLEDRGPMLDFENARISHIDLTKSVRIKDESIRLALIDYLQSISKGQTKNRDSNYETTAYFGSKKSRLKKLKAYLKGPEVLEDQKRRQAKKKPLMNEKIILQAQELARFEARIMREWMDRRAIPTNIFEFIAKVSTDKNILNEMYNEAFKDLFESMIGKEMKVLNDDEVYKSIYAVFYKTRGKTAKVFGAYQSIKAVGLSRYKREMPKTTYYRQIAELKKCGFSQADLCNLHKENNVIQIRSVINLGNLSNEMPENYNVRNLWEVA
jgi:II/X family phage/plasmid replication protein